MKILIVTDSHKQLQFLIEMVKTENPEFIFAMGDYTKDVEELSYLYPEIPCKIVAGNCDFWDKKNPEEMIVELEGHRILLVHGHLYGVKSKLDSLLKRGKQLECDIIVFGHTHRKHLESGDILLINPGAAQDKRYGLLYLTKNTVKVELKKL